MLAFFNVIEDTLKWIVSSVCSLCFPSVHLCTATLCRVIDVGLRLNSAIQSATVPVPVTAIAAILPALHIKWVAEMAGSTCQFLTEMSWGKLLRRSPRACGAAPRPRPQLRASAPGWLNNLVKNILSHSSNYSWSDCYWSVSSACRQICQLGCTQYFSYFAKKIIVSEKFQVS